jgi:transcriptional regulator GlxA family with amidase domain
VIASNQRSTSLVAACLVRGANSIPHRWLTHQRILSAQQLLEKSDRPIDWIAESVGLQTAATLREHFRRILKTTPTAYRRAFFVTARPGPGRRGW